MLAALGQMAMQIAGLIVLLALPAAWNCAAVHAAGCADCRRRQASEGTRAAIGERSIADPSYRLGYRLPVFTSPFWLRTCAAT